ncbi:MAG: hypothetical protein AAB271_02795, partial [Nitrospirota bacterium]
MTTDELEQLLAQQPIAVLHKLSRGRVHRHFRAGKRRLIELLLQHSSQNLAGLESDLQALISERHTPPHVAPTPARQTAPRHTAPPPNRRPHRAHEPESTEPGVSLAAWLEGLGVPSPQPFVPDPWQVEALA